MASDLSDGRSPAPQPAPQVFQQPSAPHPNAHPHAHPAAAAPRRRKVRKGTHTCWECKRRKVRCTFSGPGDTACVGCVRRCLRCVSQEFPEETTPAEAQSRLVGDRIVRVEEMVRRLAAQGTRVGAGGGAAGRDAAGGGLVGVVPDCSPILAGLTTPAGSSTAANSAVTPASSSSAATPANSLTPASSVCHHDATALTPAHINSSLSSSYTTPVSSILLPGAPPGQLSQALLAAFPSAADLDVITSCCTEAYNHCQLMFRSQRDVGESGFWPATMLRARPPPQAHPVIIARHMLLLAVVLQISDPRAQRGLGALSETAAAIAARLGSTAIALVTRNDELLDTLDSSLDSSLDGLEGLECIMLEAMYRGNSGQLRRSWLTWRRGLSLAQLMRINSAGQPSFSVFGSPPTTSPTSSSSASSSSTSPSPQFLWYRMLTTERFLCLLLGLPRTAADAPLPSADALGNDTPMGRLEHELGRITTYVLDRNERGPRPDDYTTTQRIDREMQAIAATLPGRWWLPPNLDASNGSTVDPTGTTPAWATTGDNQGVWEMMRLIYQAFYYNLLNQLHLPYMMRPAATDTDHHHSNHNNTTTTTTTTYNHQYSRIACVSASREVLVRYVALRRYNNIACCCRFAEFFALMASLTLLLVHIDGHRATREEDTDHNGHGQTAAEHEPNLFAHQRLSDRAMTEEAVENMALVGRLNGDVVSESSVGLVRQLLAIEADAAASGARYSLASCADDVQTAGRLRISVPYVGLITIATNGAITKEAHPQLTQSRGPASGGSIPSDAAASSAPGPSGPSGPSGPTPPPLYPSSSSTSHLPSTTRVPFGSSLLPPLAADTDADTSSHNHNHFPPPDQPTSSGPITLPMQTPCPGPTAGTDQWAFQGVDMAFFDTLMRQATVDPSRPNASVWL